MAIPQSAPTIPGRSCEGCTKCCEGWLTADIVFDRKLLPLLPDDGRIKDRLVHRMEPGNPCLFVEKDKGCNSYAARPYNPCVQFRCHYLVDKAVPESMKPSKSNVILSVEEIDGEEFIRATEAGKKMEAEHALWVVGLYINNSVNVCFTVDGRFYYLGSPKFIKAISEKYPTQNIL